MWQKCINYGYEHFQIKWQSWLCFYFHCERFYLWQIVAASWHKSKPTETVAVQEATDLTSSTRLFISLTNLWFSCSNWTQKGKRLSWVAPLSLPWLSCCSWAVSSWWSETCRWPHHLDLLGGELVLHSSTFLPRVARVGLDLWHTLLYRKQNRHFASLPSGTAHLVGKSLWHQRESMAFIFLSLCTVGWEHTADGWWLGWIQ